MEMISEVVKIIAKSVKNGGKVLVCGNGGLAAESSHFTAELVGTYAYPVYVPCLDLTSNNALVTAISNDLSFDDLFVHQVIVYGKEGDILIAMTTSDSTNIIDAIYTAKKKKMTPILLCGEQTKYDTEYKIVVSGNGTAEIQENILKYLHKLAYEVKKQLMGEKS